MIYQRTASEKPELLRPYPTYRLPLRADPAAPENVPRIFPFAPCLVPLVNLPQEMSEAARWVVWAFWWGGGRWKKEPRSHVRFRNASLINITNSENFTTLLARPRREYFDNRRFISRGVLRRPDANPRYQLDGVGFVLGDGFAGIDLDRCVTIVERPDRTFQTVVADWAREILSRFPCTYAELSPSRTGVKLFLKGQLPEGVKGAKFTGFGEGGTGAIEIYDRDRYFTVTGLSQPSRHGKLAELGDELLRFYDDLEGVRSLRRVDSVKLLNPAPKKTAAAAPMQTRPVHGLGDDALLDKARRAKNGDAFRALYDRGDLSAYDRDASKADLALCRMLAFYTGKDEARIDGLFRLSALYRDKWERPDYRQMTISRAVAATTDVYSGKRVGKTR